MKHTSIAVPATAKQSIAVVALTCALLLPASLWAQAPTLSHAVPGAVMPGQATDVTFHGGNLAGATRLWTSLPVQAELAGGIDKNGQEAGKVVYRVTAAAGAAPGIGGIRVATDKGVSNLRLFMIDDLPSLADNGQNKTIEKAQELNLPVAVDGSCEPESYDFYKFTAAKGTRVSVEVVARRLGTSLDPVIRLLDSAGHELAYSDDEPGLSADCRFAFEAPADGVYTLELRDIQYGGGAGHRYRLRVGNFPLVTVPFPLGVQPGEAAKVSFAGPDVANMPPVDLTAPVEAAGSQISVAAKLPSGGGSALARVIVDQLPEALETEPNNTLEQSTPITAPTGINGRFAEAKDRDHYRLEVKKGNRLVISGQTRGLGSPSDLFMRLLKADGASVAEAEDTGTEEGSINYTFPDDGVYHLMVEDLLRRGGPAHAYRIEVEPYQAGFSLAIDADKFDPPKGGVFVATVTATRRDYNGPITLELQGAGDGFQLANNVIPEGKPSTAMRVTVPAGLAPGHLALVSIVGKAKIGETEFTAKASTVAALKKQNASLASIPDELQTAVALGVGPVFPDFFKLSVEPAVVLLPQLVGSGSFKVKAEKLNKFDDPITLAVAGLPEGVTAEVKPIEKGKPEAVITLKGPEALPEGEHKFKLTGTATFQNQPKTVELGEVALRVTKPLVVSAAMAGPIAPGGKQKLKITITRFGDHKAPVAIALQNLPAGVTAPEGTAVPEAKNEVEIELTAAADAAVGKTENVTVVGSTKVKEQDVTALAPALIVEVK